ncbi:L-glyceraldehyde 3-phosphate reductase [Pradoshia eiseniae]|uniref:L-glyceraldehyde 3-phosphate reductase n=1 Tax=Pradoshia eiseniae TaxID=2064768 RepID=A0A2S7N0X3_9BACI|nr:aldo/keto reductase [Pradoshia eiseniae]PQD95684.1 L-glyceraldehyde 3-phosphate reductase [Pradoshia eiseniae]
MNYQANSARYESMSYRRSGKSGVLLPAISLGLWKNFGGEVPFEQSRKMVLRAFDLGITHFDLANNYGPPYGSAEETFGHILKKDLLPYRDELLISTKAGYDMWPGPYGNWGSRKYLIASLDQSLKRMGLEYVDIFYSHRPDPHTPLEETMGALDYAVRSGKALYAGISNYRPEEAKEAISILRRLGTPCLVHQPRYSMIDRWIEDGLLDLLHEEGVGSIAFSPLGRGRLTNKYVLKLEAEESRSSELRLFTELSNFAGNRGQTLSQLALSWVLREGGVTSAIIGASHVSQIEENMQVLSQPPLTSEELTELDSILSHSHIG